MITRKEFALAQQVGRKLLENTGVTLKNEELEKIAVADFGLSNLKTFGAQILTLVSTDAIATKLIAMHPFQILPEHWHPKTGEYAGKEETLRVEWGEMYLYSPGKPVQHPRAVIPDTKMDCFKSWHETIMKPGDQTTFFPETPHWFQSGPQGVVVWSFSTKVLDLQDQFTDPDIQRETIISDPD